MSVTKKSQLMLLKSLCGQNVEFLNVKTGGKYSDHWGLEGLNVGYKKESVNAV